MSAVVIDFASAAARQLQRKPFARVKVAPALSHDFKFWAGASSNRYIHTRHGLFDCPEVAPCNVMLVRVDERGRREVVYVGRLEHEQPSLNLAEIRHLGATLGAREVYLHLLAETAVQRRFVEIDLQAALAGAEQTRANAS